MTTLKSNVVTASTSRLAGGLFSSVRRLHQTLQLNHNVEIQVFAFQDRFTEADAGVWGTLTIRHFPVSGPRCLGYSPSFKKAVLNCGADIGHTHGLWMYSSIAMLDWHQKTGRPYLVSPHGMLDPWALHNSHWKKAVAWQLFEREHLHKARVLRALCASEAQSIRQLKLKNDIAVIPNGIDLPMGAVTTSPPWEGLVEPGRKVLLFLSRIHPKKGLVNLLHAWNQLHSPGNREPDWVLAIAGWDQNHHEPELKNLATELKLRWIDIRERHNHAQHRTACSLLFLGPQFNTAKDACYQHCDAFILPSFSEGLPMVVLEAWANSKPVAMTPECNLPEGFEAAAAIKMETTVASIAAGLKELRDMREAERIEMGARARKLVEERFTWARVADQLQAVQVWMLGGGNRPNCVLPD